MLHMVIRYLMFDVVPNLIYLQVRININKALECYIISSILVFDVVPLFGLVPNE